ncbi:hypothetical protein, partial [Neisseria dentiae]
MVRKKNNKNNYYNSKEASISPNNTDMLASIQEELKKLITKTEQEEAVISKNIIKVEAALNRINETSAQEAALRQQYQSTIKNYENKISQLSEELKQASEKFNKKQSELNAA